MKSIYKVLILSLFLFFVSAVSASAATFYISTTGNDTTGNGSIGTPWRTLYKACTTVTSGNTIHVNAGTYTETQQCQLPTGVSIEGDGNTSILRSSLTADFTEMLSLRSAEGTNGNQSISNIRFEGQFTTGSTGTDWGIYIGGRSNVSIHHIEMVNFRDRGIIWGGRNDNVDGPPTIYATGNTFYNNIITNSGRYVGYGTGNFNFGGQDGMLIYNNTITQTARSGSANGYGIKIYNGGYIRGCKIYNNTIEIAPLTENRGPNKFDFAIELFHESGLEVYGNTLINGGFDANFQTKGNYPYSVWIHDNTIRMTATTLSYLQVGITLEFGTEYAVVENNIIENMGLGILFTPRNTNVINNITIRKNLFKNITLPSAQSTGFGIQFSGEGQTNYFDKIDVVNNTIIIDPSRKVELGIKMPDASTGYIRNMRIINNIIANALFHPIRQVAGSVTIDNLNISYNRLYGNGTNAPNWVSATPTNYTYSNTTTTTPTYTGNYVPTGTLIDTGTPVGLYYNGSAPDLGYYETGAVDTTAPTVTSTSPTNSATGISTVAAKTIIFSEALSIGSVTTETIQLKQGSSVIPATVNYNDGVTIEITPTSELSPNTVYTLNATTVVEDIAGNNLASAFSSTFTTGSAANVLPVADAGPNQSLSLPTTSTTFAGSASDADGTIVSHGWSQVSGPNTASITTPSSYTSGVTGLIEGSYVFRLTVTDNSGGTDTDDVQITLTNPSNVYTTLNPSDKSATLVLSNGNKTVTDNGGEIIGMVRSVIPITSGKHYFEFIPTYTGTGQNLKIGIATSSATLTQPQLADNQTRQLSMDGSRKYNNDFGPVTSQIISGSNLGMGVDIDLGQIRFFRNGADLGVITQMNFTPGTAQYVAIAYWNQQGSVVANFGASPMVYPQSGWISGLFTTGNVPPVANASSDQTITLPTSSVTMAGSATDSDGTIASHVWSKISGPSTFTITDSNSYTTTITGLIEGTYIFRLTATDNSGSMNADDVTITVSPASDTTAPIISAISSGTPTTTGTTVTWTTNEASDTQIDYGTTTSYGSSTTLASSLVTSHSQALSGLAASTLYHYRVKSRDAAGNLATSTDQTFTTAAQTATTFMFTGPSSGLTNVASTSFTITPNNTYTGTITITPSGGGLSTPIVRTFSGSSAAQTFTITPTATGLVTLTATNNGGLTNPSALTYTAGLAPDTSAPIISSLSPSGTLGAGTTSTTISLVTDEASTCRYSATSGTAYASMTNTFSTTGSLAHSTLITGLTNGTGYTYYVRCIDGASNPTTNDSTITFSVATASSGGGGGGGGGGGTPSCLSGTTGVYPNCVTIVVTVPTDCVAGVFYSPSTGIKCPATNPTTPTTGTTFSSGDRIRVTKNVNVRSTPSTTGKVLGSQKTAAIGTIVSGPITANGYVWYKINYSKGVDGWSIQTSLAKSITATTPVTTPTTKTVTVTALQLNVRATPSATGALLGVVSQNTTGTRIQTSGTWLKVSFGAGLEGWVLAKWVK